MKVVIKFVEAYRPDAHRCWAAGGVAVDLLDCIPLPANFSMLVMPLLDKDAGWICCRSLRGQHLLDVKDLVAAKLSLAHALTDAENRHATHSTASRTVIISTCVHVCGDASATLLATPSTCLYR